MSPSPSPSPPFPLLLLPPELRDQIYALLFHPPDYLEKSPELEEKGFCGGVYRFDTAILRVCRLVRKEARRVWTREVVAVRVETPWGGAVNHIASEGLVPIVSSSHPPHTRALVQISAHHSTPSHTIVLLLDDLPLFTQTWFYSSLSYPTLNDRLSTTFTLSPEPNSTPLSLQRKLLLPFGQIKGLANTTITGYSPTIAAELRALMAIPPPTLSQSLDSATALLHTGDTHLSLHPPDPAAALSSYTAAFHAIHILISGRTRRVLADSFFHAQVTQGAYTGQTGMMVRVILRLRLVSRILAAFLTQANYADALFWGMRSVRIMSDSMDATFERLLADLVGGDDVALIYIRAAIALHKMRETENAAWREELSAHEGQEMAHVGTLLQTSLKHLRRGSQAVRKEAERYGLPSSYLALFDNVESHPAFSATGAAYEIYFEEGPLQ